MSYEGAPATRMLATHCCACGRPLVDATSVTMGMGPDCRAEHGWDELDEDVRQLANQLTWAAAVWAGVGDVKRVRECADAIDAMGLDRLAGLIRARFRRAERAKIVVAKHGDRILATTPFRRGMSDEYLAAWREIAGRRYEGSGTNSIPAAQEQALRALLQKFFPGEFMTWNGEHWRIPCAG